MSDTEKFNSIMADVLTEVASSIKKHGEQYGTPLGVGPDQYVLAFTGDDQTAENLAWQAKYWTDFVSTTGEVTWRDILTEEVMEAYAEDDPLLIRGELVQVAAVVVKMIYAIDGGPGGD